MLGDQGVCAIDEFDKLRSEHSALLEAMEQQSVSLAKAGVVCTLPARTAVIAAANPEGGHYDRSKTISENVKLSSPLLSRFDLVFLLLDSPDALRDERLSSHIMRLHGGSGELTSSSQLSTSQSTTDPGDLLGRLRNAPQIAPIPSAYGVI